MPKDDAAFASNWRTVLLVDAGVGAVAAAVGMLLLFVVPALGALLLAGGVTYAALVVRRAKRWAGLRRDAGL